MIRRHASVRVGFREVIWLSICAVLIAGAFLYSNADNRAPLSSAETRFVETSPGGLQIVPASCPSDPHEGGSCSGNAACNIYFVPDPVTQGQNSTVYWSAPSGGWSYTLSYPGGSNPVSAWGSSTVNGNQTKTYTLSYQSFGEGGGGFMHSGTTVSCSAILTVTPQCSPTSICGSGADTNKVVNSCTLAVIDDCVVNHGAGWTCSAGVCIPPSPGPQCTAQYFCSGSDLYYKNSQCVDSFIQHCAYGCSSSACLPTPPITFMPFTGTGPYGSFDATGHLQVRPLLVRSGETVHVYWNATNVSSCSVTGSNDDSWPDTPLSGSDGKTSSAIVKRTTYTLFCTALPGATPSSITETKTVNIIPIFEES